MKKILITGGTGFVGTHLTEALLAQNQSAPSEIYVTCHNPDKPWAYKEAIGGASHLLALNLCDAEATKSALKKIQPTEIYHLASIAQVGNSFSQARSVLENNFNLQLNLLEAIAEICPEARVLVVSSAAIYDVSAAANPPFIDEKCPIQPNNPYAASKAIQDMMAAAYGQSQGLNIVRVRPFNHIGDGQETGFAVPDFTKKVIEALQNHQTEIAVGNLEAKRDFTDVKDVVSAYMLLMSRGEANAVYNLGSGSSVTMSSILDTLIQLSGKNLTPVTDPALLRPIDTPNIVADASRLRQLGWEPKIPLAETLKRIYNYWQKKLAPAS